MRCRSVAPVGWSASRGAVSSGPTNLRQRLRELAEQRRWWGCPMLYLMPRREGWRANHKRVERLHRQEACRCADDAGANV